MRAKRIAALQSSESDIHAQLDLDGDVQALARDMSDLAGTRTKATKRDDRTILPEAIFKGPLGPARSSSATGARTRTPCRRRRSCTGFPHS